jgi:hypothetical protein
MRCRVLAGALAAACLVLGAPSGCSTAPKDESDQEALVDRAESTVTWFESNVDGLREQIDGSAGYVVFPDVAQWGVLIAGGRHGRGVVYDASGRQVGWARVNVGNIGLEAGVRGFRMLVVVQTEQKFNEFKANRWSGETGAVAVVGERAASGTVAFENGVAVYEGASSGLMAGVSIGLQNITYQPM